MSRKGIDPGWYNVLAEKGLVAAEGTSASSVCVPLFASEEEFQRAVIDLARSLGWVVAHFRKVRVQRKDGTTYWETPVQADGAGFPDLLMLNRTRQIVAELKFGKNRPSEAQKAWLGRFGAAGVPWYVWYPADWPEIVAALGPQGVPPRPPSPSGSEVQ